MARQKPSGSRLTFNKATLIDQARRRAEERLTAAEQAYKDAMDPERDVERTKAYVARTRSSLRKILDETRTMEVDAAAAVLGDFVVGSRPRKGRWDRYQLERDIERARERIKLLESRAQALTTDADGNISLTRTQLDVFFGL